MANFVGHHSSLTAGQEDGGRTQCRLHTEAPAGHGTVLCPGVNHLERGGRRVNRMSLRIRMIEMVGWLVGVSKYGFSDLLPLANMVTHTYNRKYICSSYTLSLR